MPILSLHILGKHQEIRLAHLQLEITSAEYVREDNVYLLSNEME